MKTVIRNSVKLARGVSQRVNSQNVIDFIVEVLQELASQVWERPDDLLLLALIIPTVAVAFAAKAGVLAIWKHIRNRYKTEVNSPKGTNRG